MHPRLHCFFYPSLPPSNEIYRWVKIGLWIWFIVTNLFGWIFSAAVPTALSGELHLASSHQPLRLCPRPSLAASTLCIFMFCGAELISVNFWKALCYTVKWVSEEVMREFSGWWSVMLRYSPFFLGFTVWQEILIFWMSINKILWNAAFQQANDWLSMSSESLRYQRPILSFFKL